MTSRKTTTVSTTARPTCNYPGCDQPAAQPEDPGRPPEYCRAGPHPRVGVEGTPAAGSGEERDHTQAMNRATEEVFAELVTPGPASQGEPDPAEDVPPRTQTLNP